ncbi:MAG: hypothetical protein JW789_01675 [Candidatus Aenigmarchaeota archaeon]|nr:hypothetical protein [Candidatus Aenigmarchaeota archaeon]
MKGINVITGAILALLIVAAMSLGFTYTNLTYTGMFSSVSGANSDLSVWSSADAQGGSVPATINENTYFYANFTSSADGSPITGVGVTCDIIFNISGSWTAPASMSYSGVTQLYEYARAFPEKDNYTWNVTCDGSSQGYDAGLSILDSVFVHRYEWWNNTWKYRIKIEIENGDYDSINKPVELDINFTDVLRQLGFPETFDENSTRLYEYNSTGDVMHELPSQFDRDFYSYDASGNADGTFVFILNGTTQSNTNRTFFLYFDATENGQKAAPSYATNLSYVINGDELFVNNSIIDIRIDSNRSENTSGIYFVKFQSTAEPVPFFLSSGEDARTIEYNEYSNGTYNFSFDMACNFTVVEGPVRLTVIQEGDEIIFGNPGQPTGEGRMTKKYYIYNHAGDESFGGWIKIEQNFTNTAAYQISRNSTEAGAVAFDIVRGWQAIGSGPSGTPYDGNATDPYSWSYAFSDGTEIVGLVNLEESAQEYFVTNSSIDGGRIGVHLSSLSISPGESIVQKSAAYFGRGGTTEFVNINNNLRSPGVTSYDTYESRTLMSATETDFDTYNRNETVYITLNLSYDPYGLHSTVNATLNNGTGGTGDDIVLEMYDDGTHTDSVSGDLVYSNSYNITTYDNTGLWEVKSYIYDSYGYLLNTSSKNITVTKELHVSTVIHNPQGDVSRLINASINVTNFRQGVWHPEAFINCSVYDGAAWMTEVPQANILDYGNGSYDINFTAPAYFGLFTLNCTAEKDGNDGYDAYDFTAEEVNTLLDIVAIPSYYPVTNVTWLGNESFMLRVNSTNTQNGTAFNATVNIQIPQNMTANATNAMCLNEEGGKDVLISKSCVIDFNITVLRETVPSNFTVNVSISWNNSDTTQGYNETNMNVTVMPTYILDVSESFLSSFVSSGVQKNIANVTLSSYGNAPLENVTFNVTGFPSAFSFSFAPANYSTLTQGTTETNEVFLVMPSGYSTGMYSGVINVSSANDGFETVDVNVTVSGTNMTINVTPQSITAENITYYASQPFNISFSTNNTGNITAFSANVTIDFSDSRISTTNQTIFPCGNVTIGSGCSGIYDVVVGNGTPSGNYTVNVSAEWYNPEIGIWYNISTVNITVLSNVNLTVPENSISGSLVHGTSGVIANFTLNSTGNDPVINVATVVGDEFGNFQDFSLNVVPNISQTQGGTVYAGQLIVVNITGTIPLSYPNGTYLGYVNITTNNSGFKTLDFNITVPETRTWTMTPTDCNHPESPEEGSVCNVTINNTGNVNITFSISPYATSETEYNNTWPETLNFTVENQSGTVINIMYNTTGDAFLFYEANYTVIGVGSTPANRTLSILLTPFVKPIPDVTVTPGTTPQDGSVEILVSVIDQGGVGGINKTIVSVTAPNGTIYQIQMRRLGSGTNPYLYQEFFPTDPTNGTWGSIVKRGNYSVSVYAEDNFGLNDTVNSSFFVYAVLFVNLSASRDSHEYYQGESGTIAYKLTDIEGAPLQGASVSLAITDPTNRSVGLTNSDFTTNYLGESGLYPYFQLFSDSATGIYNITSQTQFNETQINMILNDSTLSSFSVIETRPGMLILDLEAPAETSVTDGLEVMAIVTDGLTNVDADVIMVTLYDSLNNQIMTNQSMTRLSTGRYRMTYNTSVSANQGNWRWTVYMVSDGNVVTKDVYTRLIGGPFDVRDITVTDNTIPTLGIDVTIENTGGLSQDAFIQWNLTRVDTGESLQAGLDTVLIPGNSELTHTINPTGLSYIGDVRITFIVTYSGTEKAGAYEEFTTAEEGETPPPPPGGGGGDTGGEIPVGPTPVPGIEIVKYPDEIATETGWTQYPSVTVNNTGTAILRNVKLALEGIPDSWYTVTPSLIPLISPGDSDVFVVNILVPVGTEARQYYGSFNVTSDKASDSKLTSVIVFGSREELVRYQLKKLKDEFDDFKDDVNATAERKERDLTRVYDIIGEIEHQIDLTDGYLDAKMFEEALDSVTTGWRLLDRGRELLRNAPPLSPSTILVIPDWLLTLILILVIVAMAMFFVLNRYKKKLDKMFMFRKRKVEAPIMEDVIGEGPSTSRMADDTAAYEARQREKEKVEKVLGLLEKEFKEGIISENAYNELRKKNVEKLKHLGG